MARNKSASEPQARACGLLYGGLKLFTRSDSWAPFQWEDAQGYCYNANTLPRDLKCEKATLESLLPRGFVVKLKPGDNTYGYTGEYVLSKLGASIGKAWYEDWQIKERKMLDTGSFGPLYLAPNVKIEVTRILDGVLAQPMRVVRAGILLGRCIYARQYKDLSATGPYDYASIDPHVASGLCYGGYLSHLPCRMQPEHWQSRGLPEMLCPEESLRHLATLPALGLPAFELLRILGTDNVRLVALPVELNIEAWLSTDFRRGFYCLVTDGATVHYDSGWHEPLRQIIAAGIIDPTNQDTWRFFKPMELGGRNYNCGYTLTPFGQAFMQSLERWQSSRSGYRPSRITSEEGIFQGFSFAGDDEPMFVR